MPDQNRPDRVGASSRRRPGASCGNRACPSVPLDELDPARGRDSRGTKSRPARNPAAGSAGPVAAIVGQQQPNRSQSPALAVKQQCAAMSPRRRSSMRWRARLPGATSQSLQCSGVASPVFRGHHRQQLRVGRRKPRSANRADSPGRAQCGALEVRTRRQSRHGLKGLSGCVGPPDRPLNCHSNWRGVITPRASSFHSASTLPTGSSRRCPRPC